MDNFLMRLGLMVIAGVTILASYRGLAMSVPDPEDFWNLAFCAAVAAASGVSCWVFWNVSIETITKPEQFTRRSVAWLGTIAGAIAILFFSSYWNIIALGGHEAQKAAMTGVGIRAERALAQAQQQAGSFQSAIPSAQALKNEIDGLAACESSSGCVSGSPGKSGIYNSLIQLKQKAGALISSTKQAEDRLQDQFTEGRACLVKLRAAIKTGDVAATGQHIDCVNASVAKIQSADNIPRIALEFEGFTSGFIVPLSITSQKQKLALANILDGLDERAKSIAATLRSIGNSSAIETVSSDPVSPMLAVMLHYDQIIPAIVTGAALDLLPLILALFQSTLAASRRARPDAPWHKYTIGEAIELAGMSRHLFERIHHEQAQPQQQGPAIKTISVKEEELDLPPGEEWIEIDPDTGEVLGDSGTDKS